MPLPIPQLDDRTFEDLLTEARSLIPRYALEWTNHNASDPGITLVELLAWLSEMLIYRADQIPAQSIWNFLELVRGKEALHHLERNPENLKRAIGETAAHLETPLRAVTKEDYVSRSLNAIAGTGNSTAVRVECVFNRNFELAVTPFLERLGHISLIIITRETPVPEPFIDAVKHAMDRQRLLTHRIHVVQPAYHSCSIQAQITLSKGADAAGVIEAGSESLEHFFDPISGGETGAGWPLGRGIYFSEIYQVLEGVEGVDHVHHLAVNGNEEETNIPINMNELIRLQTPAIEVVEQ